MAQTKKQESTSPVVREYKIGDITYIVKAVEKNGARENAVTKVRRLIRNDLQREKSPKSLKIYTLLQTDRGVYGIIYNLFVRLPE